MALPTVVAGGLRPALIITWNLDDGEPLNLLGATLTGTITTRDGITRAITGVMSVVDATNGVFSWTLAAGDAMRGRYKVQFTATFVTGPTPAKTFETDWLVV